MGGGRERRRPLNDFEQAVQMLFPIRWIKPLVTPNKGNIGKADSQQDEQVCVKDERLAHALRNLAIAHLKDVIIIPCYYQHLVNA